MNRRDFFKNVGMATTAIALCSVPNVVDSAVPEPKPPIRQKPALLVEPRAEVECIVDEIPDQLAKELFNGYYRCFSNPIFFEIDLWSFGRATFMLTEIEIPSRSLLRPELCVSDYFLDRGDLGYLLRGERVESARGIYLRGAKEIVYRVDKSEDCKP